MKGALYSCYRRYIKPVIPRSVLQRMVNFFEKRTQMMRIVEDAQRKSHALDASKKKGQIEHHWRIPSATVQVQHIPQDAQISVVIPTKDSIDLLERCVESIYAYPQHVRFDVTIINNRSVYPDRIAALAKRYTTCRVIEYDHPFHFAKMNNDIVQKTHGTHVLLLNDDVEVQYPHWLDAMMETLQGDQVGVVGAKLLFPDNTIQHAGFYMTTPTRGIVEYWHKGVAAYRTDGSEEPGYQNSLIALREVSAVTGACLLISRALWNRLGGFDESLKIGFNDIDLCLRVQQKGFRVMVDPRAILYHHESISRKAEKNDHVLHHPEDSERFITKWSELLQKSDPHIDSELLK